MRTPALSAKLCDLAQILTQYDSLCEETLPIRATG